MIRHLKSLPKSVNGKLVQSNESAGMLFEQDDMQQRVSANMYHAVQKPAEPEIVEQNEESMMSFAEDRNANYEIITQELVDE